ncbi:MAG TPA: UvrD-helicase domain-containing protein [Solirubrobacteraceae bacterium]|nr:UvrD-helicase domain-containing protein [Solirubrobacteraceae bacterium]
MTAVASENGGSRNVREVLLERLTERQSLAVRSDARRLLVVAGAGSGKTDVMARRIAWDVGVRSVARDQIVAFTFTDRAAEEMQFRVRRYLQHVSPDPDDPTLGGMYVGTIHGYCLKQLRELDPDEFHNYDVLDEGARISLVERGYYNVLGLPAWRKALAEAEGRDVGHYESIDDFLLAYDLLNEHDRLDVTLSADPSPGPGKAEQEWCSAARLSTRIGRVRSARRSPSPQLVFTLTSGRVVS